MQNLNLIVISVAVAHEYAQFTNHCTRRKGNVKAQPTNPKILHNVQHADREMSNTQPHVQHACQMQSRYYIFCSGRTLDNNRLEFEKSVHNKMKSTEAAAKDRQSEDTAMSKILQKRIRDREPRFGIVFFPVVHALARAPRLEILSVLGAGWAWPRN